MDSAVFSRVHQGWYAATLCRLVGATAFGVFACACGPASTERAAAPTRDPAHDVGADDGSAAVASYMRGERVIHSSDPDVVFGAELPATCVAMPERAPEDAFVELSQRGRGPEDWAQFGITTRAPCRFDWSLLHLDPPPSTCAVVTRETFDALWAELRRSRFDQIATREIDDVSPHRGGYGMRVRWPGARCAVSDILQSEIVPSFDGDFRRSVRAFVEAFRNRRVSREKKRER